MLTSLKLAQCRRPLSARPHALLAQGDGVAGRARGRRDAVPAVAVVVHHLHTVGSTTSVSSKSRKTRRGGWPYLERRSALHGDGLRLDADGAAEGPESDPLAQHARPPQAGHRPHALLPDGGALVGVHCQGRVAEPAGAPQRHLRGSGAAAKGQGPKPGVVAGRKATRGSTGD